MSEVLYFKTLNKHKHSHEQNILSVRDLGYNVAFCNILYQCNIAYM